MTVTHPAEIAKAKTPNANQPPTKPTTRNIKPIVYLLLRCALYVIEDEETLEIVNEND